MVLPATMFAALAIKHSRTGMYQDMQRKQPEPRPSLITRYRWLSIPEILNPLPFPFQVSIGWPWETLQTQVKANINHKSSPSSDP